MSRSRTWVLGTAVVTVLILIAGWFLLVTPKRSDASDLQAQTVSVNEKNASLTTQIATLQAQNEKLPEQEAKLASIRQQLPDNPALPGLIRSLTDIATQSGAVLTSLAPANPKAATAPTTTSGGSSASTSSTGTTTGGTTAATSPAVTYQVIDVALVVSGSYFDIEQFLNKAEGLTRSMLVTGISITPATATAASSTGGSSAPTTTATGDVDANIQARVFYSPVTSNS